jgi:hypothetical protein
MHFTCINIPKLNLYSSLSMKVIKLTWTLYFTTILDIKDDYCCYTKSNDSFSKVIAICKIDHEVVSHIQ